MLIHRAPAAKRKPSGFTLSELLIAISVLGIIASLTIPKVLLTVETTQNKAKFKEVISSLSSVISQGLQEGSLYPNMGDANFTNYIASKLVFKKYCDSNATTQGCSAGQTFSWGWNTDRPAFLMHNDILIMLYSFQYCNIADDKVALFVDLNNGAGPNLQNVDQFEIGASFGTAPCEGRAPGTIYPHGNNSTFYNGFW